MTLDAVAVLDATPNLNGHKNRSECDELAFEIEYIVSTLNDVVVIDKLRFGFRCSANAIRIDLGVLQILGLGLRMRKSKQKFQTDRCQVRNKSGHTKYKRML